MNQEEKRVFEEAMKEYSDMVFLALKRAQNNEATEDDWRLIYAECGFTWRKQ